MKWQHFQMYEDSFYNYSLTISFTLGIKGVSFKLFNVLYLVSITIVVFRCRTSLNMYRDFSVSLRRTILSASDLLAGIITQDLGTVRGFRLYGLGPEDVYLKL